MNEEYARLRETMILEKKQSLQRKLYDSTPTVQESETLIKKISHCNKILFELKMERLYKTTTTNQKRVK